MGVPYADTEEVGWGRGSGPPPTLKNHKNIRSPSNTGPDPLTITTLYQASIQCWVIIGTPAFRKRADDCPLIVVFGTFLPPSTKPKTKTLSKLDPSGKTFWIRACIQPQNIGCLCSISHKTSLIPLFP